METTLQKPARMASVDLREWVPMPTRGGVCPVSSLRRSAIRLLVTPCAENNFKPPVKSIIPTIPGWGDGRKRLINVASLREWLESQPVHNDPIILEKMEASA